MLCVRGHLGAVAWRIAGWVRSGLLIRTVGATQYPLFSHAYNRFICLAGCVLDLDPRLHILVYAFLKFEAAVKRT
jgi:hypothetical protein